MNDRQIECILILAEEKSFSEAAKRLGISQPSLSQYIQKIEAECGNELFERSIPLKLTYAGEIILEHAKKIVHSKKQMEEILADVSSEEAGRLIIGTGPINSITFLPSVVCAYKRKFPKIEIILREYYEKELEIMETEGKIDLAISTRILDPNKFEYVRLFEEESLLAVRADSDFAKKHPAAPDGSTVVDAKSCLSLPFIEMDDFFPIQKRLTEMFNRYQVTPHYTVKCGSIMTAYSLAKTGIGAMLLPSGAIKYSSDDQMRYYTLDPKPGVRPFGIYYSKGKYCTKAMREFIHLVEESISIGK